MVDSGTTIIRVGHKAIFEQPNITLRSFSTSEGMVEALLANTLKSLEADIRNHGRASWAVSGGSTPAPLFDAATKANIDWSRVDIALVDERWVPSSHPRSNEAFIKNQLLQGHAAKANFTGLFMGADSHHKALPSIEAEYQKLALPFSNVLLGMGNDGHTASLFPAAEGLERAMSLENKSLCAAITAQPSAVTGAETERVTLTRHAIREAKTVCLMLSGQEKMDTLTRAMKAEKDLPIARVIDALERPMTIYWAA